MDERDDTVKGGKVLPFSVVKGDKAEPAEACSDSLTQLDSVREQITSDRLTSMVLFAVTSDGEYTRIFLSKNRFELLGLVKEIEEYCRSELFPTYQN